MIAIPELIKEQERNFFQTQSLIDDHCILSPFPNLERTIAQSIRNQETELNRAWRIKKGVGRGLLVLASMATYGDEVWYHVSYSRRKEIPSYAQTCWVKNTFFGSEMKAIAVYPKAEKHVNIHPSCLHLWANLMRDPLPDFDVMGFI